MLLIGVRNNIRPTPPTGRQQKTYFFLLFFLPQEQFPCHVTMFCCPVKVPSTSDNTFGFAASLLISSPAPITCKCAIAWAVVASWLGHNQVVGEKCLQLERRKEIFPTPTCIEIRKVLKQRNCGRIYSVKLEVVVGWKPTSSSQGVLIGRVLSRKICIGDDAPWRSMCARGLIWYSVQHCNCTPPRAMLFSAGHCHFLSSYLSLMWHYYAVLVKPADSHPPQSFEVGLKPSDLNSKESFHIGFLHWFLFKQYTFFFFFFPPSVKV